MDQIAGDYEYAQGTITRLEGDIFSLDERIESHESKISTLEEEVQTTKTKMGEMNDDLKHEMTQMRREMENKARKIEDEMRVMKNTYSTAQIALSFERDLAKYVYPDEKKNGANQTFTIMKEWLGENEKTPQGKEANEKWNALQKKVSWTTMHENVLKKLRDSLMGLAHPSLDLETAKSRIPDEVFNAEEKKCIEDIIDIIKEVEAA